MRVNRKIIVSIVLLSMLSTSFLVMLKQSDAYEKNSIGDVSTSILTYSFDEDFVLDDSTMKYDPSYNFNKNNIDTISDSATRKIFDYSQNNNDGVLCAGPGGQSSMLQTNNNHDHPQRTGNSINGRAIDFWIPPEEKYSPTSECRYIRTPSTSSLQLSTPPWTGVKYYDFEFYLWQYRDIDFEGNQVIINNLWDVLSNTIPPTSQTEGYYRILINNNGNLIFEYPHFTSNGVLTQQIQCTQSIDYFKWNRINIRFIMHGSGTYNWGARVIFHIDGEEASRHSTTMIYYPYFTSPTKYEAFTIGADPFSKIGFFENNPKQFYGMVDELKIKSGMLGDNDGWADTAEKIRKCITFLDFDEGGGLKTLDQTPNDNDGTLTSSSIWDSTNGIYGNCIDLQGDTDYVIIADDDDFHMNDEFFIELWVNPDTNPTSDHTNLISKAFYNNKQPYYSYFIKIKKDRRINFGVGVNNPNAELAIVTSSTTGTIPLNEWSHIAATYQNGVLCIYINGILKATSTFDMSGRAIQYNDNDVYIGRYKYLTPWNYLEFDGKIDQVGIYNYVKEFNPEIVRYEFEDGSGNLVDDWTPFGNNGNLDDSGAQFSGSGRFGECVDLSSDYTTNPRVKIDLEETGDDVIDGEFTVDVWLKPESDLTGPSVIASQEDSWELGMDLSNLPYFKVKETGGSWITATHTLSIIGDYNGETDYNSWHHLMGVYDSDQIFIFLDGKSGYCDATNDAIRSFTSYTRQTSTKDVYLGTRYISQTDQYQDQYFGFLDSFRLRKGVFDLTEDPDGDNMVDKYEIMRSLHSDQFDPFVHNTRFATLVSGTQLRSYHVYEERHFKIESYDMYNVLKKLGYDDDDIIYLDNDDIYRWETAERDWGQPHFYENGIWIDGEATVINIRNMFTKLSTGGLLNLQTANANAGGGYITKDYTVPKLDENDFFFWESNSHGGRTDIDTPPIDGNKERTFYFVLTTQLVNGVYTYPYHKNVDTYNEVTFSEDLDKITFNNCLIVVSACFSGGLLKDYNICGDNRIIITSSSDVESGSTFTQLSWSARIGGNSSSSHEIYKGYSNPTDAFYATNNYDLLKLNKYHLNADDIDEGWVVCDSNGEVDIPYKEKNNRNVIVSVQEAFNIADMWIQIHINNEPLSYKAPPGMSVGDPPNIDVPNQMML